MIRDDNNYFVGKARTNEFGFFSALDHCTIDGGMINSL